MRIFLILFACSIVFKVHASVESKNGETQVSNDDDYRKKVCGDESVRHGLVDKLVVGHDVPGEDTTRAAAKDRGPASLIYEFVGKKDKAFKKMCQSVRARNTLDLDGRREKDTEFIGMMGTLRSTSGEMSKPPDFDEKIGQLRTCLDGGAKPTAGDEVMLLLDKDVWEYESGRRTFFWEPHVAEVVLDYVARGQFKHRRNLLDSLRNMIVYHPNQENLIVRVIKVLWSPRLQTEQDERGWSLAMTVANKISEYHGGAGARYMKALLGGDNYKEYLVDYVGGALHRAAQKGHGAIARVLLEHGADVNSKAPKNGYTPLHLACAEGHKDVIEILMENNADTDAKTTRNETPCDQLSILRSNYHELKTLLGCD